MDVLTDVLRLATAVALLANALLKLWQTAGRSDPRDNHKKGRHAR